jgi:hypothetical protein
MKKVCPLLQGWCYISDESLRVASLNPASDEGFFNVLFCKSDE